MKYIEKNQPPHELHAWIQTQPVVAGQRLNCSYSEMPSDVKNNVKRSLLQEQGSLCCYTGRRIDIDTSHIEHLKPQSHCQANEDIDYQNLLLAFPGSDIGRVPYGAQRKADWYDESLLVSPLRRDCEARFLFQISGAIKPAKGTDQAACKTIERLGLDEPTLTEMRKQAIQKALIDRKLSNQNLERIANSFCDRDGTGKFPPFCFAISQAAAQVLQKRARVRQQKQYRTSPRGQGNRRR